jgi:hypothetical protein
MYQVLHFIHSFWENIRMYNFDSFPIECTYLLDIRISFIFLRYLRVSDI